jgi:acyl-CoA-binding protein
MADQRFRSAIMAARSLPPNLLSQAQKLKLYALFQQSQSPAPEEPPSTASELQVAKWEAWRDVRSLSKLKAMESYSEIIEGLVSMVSSLEQEGSQPNPPRPPPQAHASRQPQQQGQERAQLQPNTTRPVLAGAASSNEEGRADEPTAEVTPRPPVTETVWSTAKLTISPGDVFEMPLAYECASRCTYSYEIVGGTGPVAFSIRCARESIPKVSEYKSDSRGAFELVSPSSGTSAVLIATLDNTSSMLASLDIKCRVCLEPVHELAARDAYDARQELRDRALRKEEELVLHAKKTTRIEHEVQQLESTLAGLREQMAAVEGEIQMKYKLITQGAEVADAMEAEILELRKQLSSST